MKVEGRPCLRAFNRAEHGVAYDERVLLLMEGCGHEIWLTHIANV